PKKWRKGWSATRRLGDSATRLLRRAANQAAEEQHQQRAEGRDGDGAKIEITGGHASPAESRADHSAENCPEDAKEDREDATGRIAAGHEELCERTRDQSQEDPEQPEWHAREAQGEW